MLSNETQTIKELYDILFPLNRSLISEGTRKSLEVLKKHVPFIEKKVPSGTKVNDWIVPKEWIISNAWIKNSRGEKIIDFQNSNLHVVGYSISVDMKMPLAKLKEHLHFNEALPDAIPYVTSYYKPYWGFCLTKNQFDSLPEDTYHVYIDSSHIDSHLEIAEYYIKSDVPTEKEILITSYLCHPSLANNELSGPIVLTLLASWMTQQKNKKFNFRFILAPETIGAISLLSLEGNILKKTVEFGFVITCCGDPGQFTVKKAKTNRAQINDIILHELKILNINPVVHSFFPYGSDERQYSSPGYNIDMASIMRSMYGEYLEYHTSKDNLDFVSPESTNESLSVYKAILDAINKNVYYVSLKPFGEPMLSRYGIYPTLGSGQTSNFKIVMNWILNLGDGTNNLFSVAQRCSVPISEVWEIFKILEKNSLVKEILSPIDRID